MATHKEKHLTRLLLTVSESWSLIIMVGGMMAGMIGMVLEQ